MAPQSRLHGNLSATKCFGGGDIISLPLGFAMEDNTVEYFTYADVSMTNKIEYLMAMGVKVYYHQGHSWAIPESGNVVRVGIDDFAQKLVGKIDAIKCPQVGSEVTQGEKAWTLLVNSKSIDMLSPVDGKIVDINESLLSYTHLRAHETDSYLVCRLLLE